MVQCPFIEQMKLGSRLEAAVPKVKQILNSVLDNALKYTNKGFVEFRASAIIKYDVCRLILVVEDSDDRVGRH